MLSLPNGYPAPPHLSLCDVGQGFPETHGVNFGGFPLPLKGKTKYEARPWRNMKETVGFRACFLLFPPVKPGQTIRITDRKDQQQ